MSHAIFRAVNLWGFLRHPRLVEKFRRKTGHFPNIASPRTVQEKFLWRKIFDHDPRFVRVQDKLGAKEYARRKAAGIGIPATLWVGTDLADAPPELLQQPGMLKANHSCGTNIALPDATRSPEALRRLANGWLREGYGRRKGEWAYAGIERKLFIEEMLRPSDGGPPGEIKVHACAGQIIVWSYGKQHATYRTVNFFHPDGTRLVSKGGDRIAEPESAPSRGVEKVLAAAKKISAEFDYVRVDTYLVDGRIYTGEMTIYNRSGFPSMGDEDLFRRWARLWDLRKSRFLSTPQKGWRGHYARALRAHLDSRGG